MSKPTKQQRREAASRANPLIGEVVGTDTLSNVRAAIMELGSVYTAAAHSENGHAPVGLYWLMLPLEAALGFEESEMGGKGDGE